MIIIIPPPCSLPPPPPPPPQILEGSGVLAADAGAFFYDKNLTLIDSLADEMVRL